MKTTAESILLDERILVLQNKQAYELVLLKEQFQITEESLKPSNLIKSTFNEVTSSSVIGRSLLNGVMSLTSGYLSQKTVFGIPINPVQKIVRSAFQFLVKKIKG
jgi:hypothetical protein